MSEGHVPQVAAQLIVPSFTTSQKASRGMFDCPTYWISKPEGTYTMPPNLSHLCSTNSSTRL
jgi:hypothetical protein